MAEHRLLLDLGPLRLATFRRLWIGSTLSALGSQMTTFAVALQVYRQTHSSAAVGAIGLVAALPAICFSLLGGAVIDAVDRRRLVLLTSGLLAATSSGFAAQALLDSRQLWVLYLLIASQALLSSVDAPARRTFLPRLLRPDQVPAGLALSMLTMHLSLLIGPLLAGLLAAAGGVKVCYLADAASFLAALYAIAGLPAMPSVGQVARPGLRAVRDGLRFIRRSKILAATLLADANATVLAMPVALFPAINAERFGGSPRSLGLFTAALAAGGLLGSGLSGPLGRLRRPGRAMLVAAAVWGFALAAFGMVEGLAATLACLVLAGTADVVSVLLRSAIIVLETPDEFRGRVNAAEYLVGTSMPQVGNFRAGVVGSLTTPGISALTGGLAASAGTAVLALAFPTLVNYRRGGCAQRAA